MRAFHGVSAALLKWFPSTDAKTFEHIEHLHTYILQANWVENIILPTFLVHPADLVIEWINAFPLINHVSQCLDYLYSANIPDQMKQMQRKEEFFDANDHRLIDAEVEKYPHPLEDKCPHLFNPVTGHVAPSDVNVVDSMLIEECIHQQTTWRVLWCH